VPEADQADGGADQAVVERTIEQARRHRVGRRRGGQQQERHIVVKDRRLERRMSADMRDRESSHPLRRARSR